nr:MAG TPA: hypothetical protein [Caudoviricetes sp.]
MLNLKSKAFTVGFGHNFFLLCSHLVPYLFIITSLYQGLK